jgi:dihydroflavonol-4-reductase
MACNCSPVFLCVANFVTARSKTLAEKAAWKFVDDRTAAGERCFSLAVINPSYVIGPVLSANYAVSFSVAKSLLLREMPAVPNLGLVVVDVRCGDTCACLLRVCT